MFPTNIVDWYYLDRTQAETADDKRRVWRTYARAVIQEFQRPERSVHRLGEPVIVWRTTKKGPNPDDSLPVRCPPYWARLSLTDLQELWGALERARHRADDGEE